MASIALAIGGRALGGTEYGGILSAVGAAAGAFIDSQLFGPSQPNQVGPRLSDLSVQLATYGLPIPMLWGKDRLAGNMIWATSLVEVATEQEADSGGKSDGPSQTTYTYFGNYAIGLCKGPIDSVTQIYADKQLIWEPNSGSEFDDCITIYTGTDTQLPDPTIESHEGVGNVPAFRGTAYIVFDMLPLARFGNRMPQIEVVALAKTSATIEYDGNFVMKSAAPESASSTLWRNFSEGPDRFGNAVFYNAGSAEMMCISPAGDTVWAKTGADVVADINTFSLSTVFSSGLTTGTAAIINTVDPDDPDQAQKSHVLYVGKCVKDTAHYWCVAALYECVASGDPVFVGWYRVTMNVTQLPYTAAGSVFLNGDHTDEDSIYVAGTMSIGAFDLGWRVFPSVAEFISGAALSETGMVSREIPNAILYWSGETGQAFRFFQGNGVIDGDFNVSSSGGWCVPRLVTLGGPVIESHMCFYLPYGWMQANTAGGTVANPETRDILAPAYPNGCVVDINLRLASNDSINNDTNTRVGTFTYWGARAIAEGPFIEIGRSYDVVNSDFVNALNVAQVPFGEEGKYIDGTGSKGVTENSYSPRPTLTRMGSAVAGAPSNFLIGFNRLGNGNTTDTVNKTLWPLEIRAFLYSFVTFKYTQAGQKHGYIYSKDELGVGGSQGYPDDNTRMLWLSNGQLYVWGITGNSSLTRPNGVAYLTRFGRINLDGTCTLDIVVADICNACGMDGATDYDVTDLESTTVRGYTVGREMSGRAAIEPLQSVYFVDAVESDDKLKFTRRTGTSVATISEDLLGASSGTDQAVKFAESRADEVTLPVSVAVKYTDLDQDYQQGTQQEKRNKLATDSSQQVSVEVPIVLIAQEAKGVAQKTLYLTWIGRTQIQATLPPEFMQYDSGDVVTFVYENGTASLPTFITRNDFGADWVVQVEGMSADSVALIAAATPTEVVFPVQTVTTPGLMTLYNLDGPLLRDEDDAAGFYQVARWNTATTKGGTEYVSPNDSDFSPAETFTVSAITGTTSTALGEAATTWYEDKINTVTVVLDDTTRSLSSVSKLDMCNGANRALIGADGRWELIAFKTVTQTGPGTYMLSGLLRGLQGTEWAMGLHTSSDTFVLLQNNGSVKSLVTTMGQVGTLRYYRPVSFGSTVAATDSVTFTQHANRLKPLAPCHLAPSRSGGTLAVSFNARSRTNIGLHYSGPAYDEPVAKFEVDILDGSSPPAVLRTITDTASGGGSVVNPDARTFTYSSADQTTDGLTPGDPVSLKLYAISSRVGRGYPASQTL